MKRPEWDEFWFVIAAFYSTRGTCPRMRTATVLVDTKNRMISAGYNGSLPNMPHCDEAGCLIIEGHCERTFHGEENAIYNAGDLSKLEGATAYVLRTPCLRCIRALIRNGVKKILYTGAYENARGKEFIDELAKRNNVGLKQIDIDLKAVLARMFSILEHPGGFFHQPD